ncbi:TPA: hypothetical protein JD834_31050 [Klebsiella oxytoca]|nr:hypothetical protein [Klebsiella oxytoca]
MKYTVVPVLNLTELLSFQDDNALKGEASKSSGLNHEYTLRQPLMVLFIKNQYFRLLPELPLVIE